MTDALLMDLEIARRAVPDLEAARKVARDLAVIRNLEFLLGLAQAEWRADYEGREFIGCDAAELGGFHDR
jgi:hypothetical protein